MKYLCVHGVGLREPDNLIHANSDPNDTHNSAYNFKRKGDDGGEEVG